MFLQGRRCQLCLRVQIFQECVTIDSLHLKCRLTRDVFLQATIFDSATCNLDAFGASSGLDEILKFLRAVSVRFKIGTTNPWNMTC
jgi:hypothetical protein